ncbi:MAG: carbamoyltransferase HypF [Oligoflexus sp.]
MLTSSSHICEHGDIGNICALMLEIQGMVQGVGFRPYVYQLASRYQLGGWVKNTNHGVLIHIEGYEKKLSAFLASLKDMNLAHARIETMSKNSCSPQSFRQFTIIEDDMNTKDCQYTTTEIPHDLAVCSVCQHELFDPKNRRFAYPFISCTSCGPRFTILHKAPFERCHTTLTAFPMCSLCQQEYSDPTNHRFHAQTISCGNCGPSLRLLAKNSELRLQDTLTIIKFLVQKIEQGAIIAVKGIGGFHLLVDACHEKLVRTLRQKKRPSRKPFAIMLKDLSMVEQYCQVSAREKAILSSPQAPIVIVKKRVLNDLPASLAIADSVAPGLDSFGVMLPYTPLYLMLIRQLTRPLLVTSANNLGEPISYQDEDSESLASITEIADYTLLHNLAICHPADDSIVRCVFDQPILLRMGRGFAPASVAVSMSRSRPTWAVGANSKNAFAMGFADRIVLSQYIGDVEHIDAIRRAQNEAQSYEQLYSCKPELAVADLHPAYGSTRIAEVSGLPVTRVPHHLGHVLACIAEHRLSEPVLGISWDGSGLGTDGAIWGGEFFYLMQNKWCRVAHFDPFPLIGGDIAIRQPKRLALSLLFRAFGPEKCLAICQKLGIRAHFSDKEWHQLFHMLRIQLNCPLSSSVGRLFDGVASILNLCQVASYDAEAAMRTEMAAAMQFSYPPEEEYSISLNSTVWPCSISWQGMLQELVGDRLRGLEISRIAAKFHLSLAKVCTQIAQLLRQRRPELRTVVLSGGVFQNRYLLELAVHALQEFDFRAYWHQKLPSNDASLAVGQILYEDRQMTCVDNL